MRFNKVNKKNGWDNSEWNILLKFVPIYCPKIENKFLRIFHIFWLIFFGFSTLYLGELKASFGGLLGLIPGNLIFQELKFFVTNFLELLSLAYWHPKREVDFKF